MYEDNFDLAGAGSPELRNGDDESIPEVPKAERIAAAVANIFQAEPVPVPVPAPPTPAIDSLPAPEAESANAGKPDGRGGHNKIYNSPAERLQHWRANQKLKSEEERAAAANARADERALQEALTRAGIAASAAFDAAIADARAAEAAQRNKPAPSVTPEFPTT